MDLDQAELNGLCERDPQGSDDYEQVKPPSEYECHAVPSAGTLRDKQWQSAPDKYGSPPTQRLTQGFLGRTCHTPTTGESRLEPMFTRYTGSV